MENTNTETFYLAPRTLKQSSIVKQQLPRLTIVATAAISFISAAVVKVLSFYFVLGLFSGLIPPAIIATAIAFGSTKLVDPEKRPLTLGFSLALGHSLAAMTLPLFSILIEQMSWKGGLISVVIGFFAALLALLFIARPSWTTAAALTAFHAVDIALISLSLVNVTDAGASASWGGLVANILIRMTAIVLLIEGLQVYNRIPRAMRVRVLQDRIGQRTTR